MQGRGLRSRVSPVLQQETRTATWPGLRRWFLFQGRIKPRILPALRRPSSVRIFQAPPPPGRGKSRRAGRGLARQARCSGLEPERQKTLVVLGTRAEAVLPPACRGAATETRCYLAVARQAQERSNARWGDFLLSRDMHVLRSDARDVVALQ
jgi:hypothetical protein